MINGKPKYFYGSTKKSTIAKLDAYTGAPVLLIHFLSYSLDLIMF